MNKTLSAPAPETLTVPVESPLVKVKFGAVAVVCRECEERSSGPKKLKSKTVRKVLKVSLLRAPVRVRVVESSCLGLCPKKAIAVTAAGIGHPLLAAELQSEADVEAFAAAVGASFELPRSS